MRLRKSIKKFINLFWWLLFAIAFVILLLFSAIHLPYVQNRVFTETKSLLETKLGNHILFNSVRLRPLNTLRFKNLYISDMSNDTLLYAAQCDIALKGILPTLFTQNKDRLMIKRIQMDSSYFRFFIDTTGRMNLGYILDELLPDKKQEEKAPFRMSEVNIQNSRVAIKKYDAKPASQGLNPANMLLNEVNIKVRRFMVANDTVSMDIRDLSAIEKSGFGINRLRARFEVGNSFMHFQRLFIETFHSRINAHQVFFDFQNISDFRQGFYGHMVRNSFILNESMVNLIDVGYFTDALYNYNQEITISGNVDGFLNNLNGKSINIKYGSASELTGNFDINGLPNGKETFVVFDLPDFSTNIHDLENLILPKNKRIVFPDNFKDITQLRYQGNFTGFFTDFVSYGTLTTNQGKIRTDITIQPDTAGTIKVMGQISSQDFEAGPLFGLEKVLGKISLDAQVSGIGQPGKGFETQIEGNISSFEVYNYNYSNIHVDGKVAQRKFNGLLTIDDPNLQAEFDGLVDLSSAIREYNFTTNVANANLYQLNLNKTDSNYQASFILEANATGNNLNEFDGEINLINSLFSKEKKQIQIYGLNIIIENDSTRNQVKVHSDILDLSIDGKYHTIDLPAYFKQIVHNSVPALLLCPDSSCIKSDPNQPVHFTYQLNCKRVKQVLDFFLPEILIAEKTLLHGAYDNRLQNTFSFHLESPEFGLGKHKFQNLVVNIEKDSDTIYMDAGSENLLLADRIKLDNFNMLATAANDLVTLNTRWLNWDTVVYKGDLRASCKLEKRLPGKPSLQIELPQTHIILADTIWDIASFNIHTDTNLFQIQNFKLTHKNQYFQLDGQLTNDSKNQVSFAFHKFDLAQLNIFLKQNSMALQGIIEGEGQIEGTLRQPRLSADIEAKAVELNQRKIGDIHLYSQWNNQQKAVFIDGYTRHENEKNLEVKGYYRPQNKGNIDMTINFNKFRVDVFRNYLRRTFHEVDGYLTGSLVIDGQMSNPSLNGQIKVDKGRIGIDYLKTMYTFTDDVAVVNNNFIFDQLQLYDTENNSGYLNGTLHVEKLKNLSVDLHINANNLRCLNTSVNDNPTYFGTASADGVIRIQGPTNNLNIDITGRTGPNTQFNIPVGSIGTVSDFDFITFFNNDTTAQSSENEYDVAPVQSTLSLDFNLHVTPDAEVQIIFDPKLGDIIRATGEGDLQFTIDNSGRFKMMGEYAIDKGDYLFTLQNVINKKFKVKEGSSLRWSGDPLNASINVEAYYRTKASLYGLFGYDVEGARQYQSRTTVDCELVLSGNLLEPKIDYNIYLPYAEAETRDRVQSRIADEEKLGKQFLSLLVLNSFYLDQPSSGAGSSEDANNNQRIANVNASELLSNQLSNWLSQISDDFDIGVNYRPGDNISSSEVELALSTQLLNDQLSVNGSVDMRTNAEASNVNQVVGDIDVDYKLTRSGKIRLRAFNRSNDDQIRNYSPYTQGFGIYFVEEFNSLDELWNRYTSASTKKDSKTPASDTLINNQNQ